MNEVLLLLRRNRVVAIEDEPDDHLIWLEFLHCPCKVELLYIVFFEVHIPVIMWFEIHLNVRWVDMSHVKSGVHLMVELQGHSSHYRHLFVCQHCWIELEMWLLFYLQAVIEHCLIPVLALNAAIELVSFVNVPFHGQDWITLVRYLQLACIVHKLILTPFLEQLATCNGTLILFFILKQVV